jgi:hypothetical protein
MTENISNEVSAISPGELQRVITNLVRRCQEYARADGDDFQHSYILIVIDCPSIATAA